MHAREKELMALGLTEKEAKVYLSSLELGESPVQDIARKAGVNRATTYVMIEQLAGKGLMSSVERGKKRYFIAETPDKLSSRIRLQITELEEKLGSFKRVLPDLHALYDTSGERPRLRFFEGEEAVYGLIQEINDTIEAGIEVRQLLNVDDFVRLHGDLDALQDAKGKMLHTPYHSRVLYIADKAMQPPAKAVRPPSFEARRLPKNEFNFHGELLIIKNKIFFVSYHGKRLGAILESEDMANMLRVMFDLAWMGSEKIHHTEGHVKHNMK